MMPEVPQFIGVTKLNANEVNEVMVCDYMVCDYSIRREVGGIKIGNNRYS